MQESSSRNCSMVVDPKSYLWSLASLLAELTLYGYISTLQPTHVYWCLVQWKNKLSTKHDKLQYFIQATLI